MTTSAEVLAVGVDLVDVSRIARALERTPGLVDRLFTAAERARCNHLEAQDAALLFAAKEAVMKALGRGVDSLAFTDIEIDLGGSAVSPVVLSGRAAARAGELRVTAWALDVGFVEGPTGPVAMAEVVAE